MAHINIVTVYLAIARRVCFGVLLPVLFSFPTPARAYSVLTHEAIIDALWEPAIKPLLLKKFGTSTPGQLLAAHGYAYGGCIIQDVGYYPFGSHLFSDLTHYVNSGDFVVALVRDAGTLEEYAFALGALAHYGADVEGHPQATNRAVPALFPKLRRKYGSVVTYEQNPAAHVQTEFGFDVVQVARGNYAPKAYHDFIGFAVSKELLERAFEETYGVPLKSVFRNFDLALSTYRYSVSTLIPEMTKAAWSLKKKDILKNTPGITQRKFRYYLSRSSYRTEWGAAYERPGPGARLIAFFFRIVPKVGPFRALGFKTPTPEVEAMFEKSFDATVARDKQLYLLESAGTLTLPNTDLDTGKPSSPGEYQLADRALEELTRRKAAALH